LALKPACLAPSIDRTGDVADGDVGRHDVVVAALGAHGRRHDPDLRIGLDAEEVVRAKVVVTSTDTRIEAGGLDHDLGVRRARIVFIDLDRAGHVGERAADGGDHHVLG
jgi:hypothetical protein